MPWAFLRKPLSLDSGRLVTSSPSKRTWPLVGLRSLRDALPRVVLPLPDSPTTARVSPLERVRETPSTALTGMELSSPFLAWK
ncbi:MAG: hypothetical protein HW388_587 [Dehalococcoidia bacterium]|nr:hypothetical protein [Dehalococcoidia bacterium]